MSIHDDIEARRKASQPEAAELKTFRRYARGKQDSTLNAQQKLILQNLTGKDFCDNVLGRALSEVRNRLQIGAFEVEGYGRDDDDVTTGPAAVLAYLYDLWTLQSLPQLSSSVHWATMRDGDHAVSLDTVDSPSGETRVVLRRELWWNGASGLWLAYDDAGRPEYAVKDWKTETDAERRIIYYRDRLERYRKTGEGWQPYALEGDPEAGGEGVVPWTMTSTMDGEPLGLPVVHFRNNQVPQDPEGGEVKGEPDPAYGTSELSGGLLGLQDEINDVQRDITAAARFAGFPMMGATGIELPDPDDPNADGYRPQPGTMFESENEDANFFRIEAGSIETLSSTLTEKLEAVSRGASVPMYTIQGDWPSGEALIRAEMPLISKVQTIGESFGPSWASLMHKATRLHNAFAGGTLDESLMISTVFKSAERRDRGTELELEKKELENERLRVQIEADRAALRERGGVQSRENAINDEAAGT